MTWSPLNLNLNLLPSYHHNNEHQSTVTTDLYYIVGIAATFGIFKFIIEHLILKRVAQRIFIDPIENQRPRDTKSSTQSQSQHKARKTAGKFQATGFRAFLNLVISSAGIISAYHSPWFWDSKAWFTVEPIFVMSSYNRAHYLIDAGAYLFQLLSVNFETRQSDYVMMVIHHVVTLSLIGISYSVGHTRVGEVVMLLHDICDPPLEIAKLFLYLDYPTPRDFFFHLFATLFIISRDLVFPLLVLRGIMMDGYLPDGSPVAYLYECLFFLSILQVLNFIWSYLIYRSATQPKLTDVREE